MRKVQQKLQEQNHTGQLTNEEYWNEGYTGTGFDDQADHDVAVFLNKNLPVVKGKTCFEIGSFPGAFLPTIGRKGFIINGIDYNERNSDELPRWLNNIGVKTGKFITGDFFKYLENTEEQFDLVCSFGFIEHFENFEEVIHAHIKMVKRGGQIVITTPNFHGLLQKIPRRIFDKGNLEKHYLPSMDPGKWKLILEKNGFNVTKYGYFGGYSFWVERNVQRNKMQDLLLKITEKIIYQFKKIFKTFSYESSAFSAYCGIVAKRNL